MFSEGLSVWWRGQYRLETVEGGDVVLLADLNTLQPYTIPLPDRRHRNPGWQETGERQSPLFELLALGGTGAHAQPLDAQLTHWTTCRGCARCDALLDRVVQFANHWGVLGLAGLEWLGYLSLVPWRQRPVWSKTTVPSYLKPEPVVLFLYGATMLWRWWHQYRQDPFPPPATDARWDPLLWGTASVFRPQMERVLEQLYRIAPQSVPPGHTAREMAHLLTETMIEKPTLVLEMATQFLVEQVGSPWTESPYIRREDIDALMQTVNPLLKNAQALGTSSTATPPAPLWDAMMQHPDRVAEFLNRLAVTAGQPGIGPGMEIILTRLSQQAAASGQGDPSTIRALWNDLAVEPNHPGLNTLLTPIRLAIEPQGPIHSTTYQVPSLWHALHVELYLHLVRGDAVLAACAWEKCGGPFLRIPRSERSETHQYCSTACRQAAYRARRREHQDP